MRFVSGEREVVQREVENGLDVRIQGQLRLRAGGSGQLGIDLFEMIAVDVSVTDDMDEVAVAKPGALGDHHRQQRVGGDVEGDAKKQIGTPLVELTRELPIAYVELEKHMAWGQRHLLDLPDVPGIDDQPT